MSPRGSRPTTAVVGAGRLARALLPRLQEKGYRLTAVYARRAVAARRAVRGLRGVRSTTRLDRAVAGASLVLLAVPDRAIAAVARQLAGHGDWSGRVVLHHAGSLGPEVLAPLSCAGTAVGVFHPLQCLGDPGLAATVLPGSRARIEGDPAAAAVARRLARDLGLVPLRLPPALSAAQRQAYHAAASLVSNDLLALLGLGAALLERAGLPADDAIRALLPLTRGTLAQLEASGFGSALTGPVVRGDLDTLRGHLKQLARVSKDAPTVHRLLSLELLELARSANLPIEPSLERRIREL